MKIPIIPGAGSEAFVVGHHAFANGAGRFTSELICW